MKVRQFLTVTIVAFAIACCLVMITFDVVRAQTSNPFPDQDKFGRTLSPRWTSQVVYSPNDLAHNAVVLPATGTATPNTNIVRVGQAKELTYLFNCTQGTITVTANVYVADDTQSNSPAWVLYGSYAVVSAAATGPQVLQIATELAQNTTSGTIPTTPILRLPLAAISFNEQQTGATPGTCTSHLNVGYN
jgi:hypothetical protein